MSRLSALTIEATLTFLFEYDSLTDNQLVSVQNILIALTIHIFLTEISVLIHFVCFKLTFRQLGKCLTSQQSLNCE